ncbi:CoB--CoM heterodisulfide reductase iron-sulfur subunit A family protein [Geobacter sulfurreducens]|uniref:Heterodisulfide oxidoreductase, FAD-binding and iron-sulfur cluster-binding subunit A n=1 Tax=Geobacter sulfurreducens (strain ATCC 51573 / DSM 12127 / PCA) TaxID=243231 RepID=Q74H03_GEOSL|nr:CoB--CoM heterodisulfide reductase iron-sulfur subunit A family protein [Geobacter sulfurreducens]AAR33425.1 heterodisulfide oxidoreductase, FAD-binding and iron-sulfur cluster-binding subunit A [Geobacter sulfurreducens PCA]ADI82928.1 heterodisulfide oxidoreductase, FAD-binding and iron-sulfur cluster-binding subunit A [Geobacter sulfurreducens KN400]AJY69820.1 disulfide reductase [Geobacter sulfurreducens]QVW35370.1 CoB--CoM heterodisulfide reductase iron-sulfur subunit A family protein [G
MSRIGVFVCHCGENISRTVDVERVAGELAKVPGVAFATDYKYMCSDPGQGLLKKAVAEHRLDGVVVAACSPRMHEKTFRTAAKAAGLNPFLCEMANIREHCSWVHEDRDEATAKAISIVEMMVARVKKDRRLVPITVPVTKRALVIGGGIAGIQAALDIADAGHKVVLVEREPSIGGHMAQLSETFPTLDCSQCIMTPKMVDVANHPNITLHTYSEIESVDGYIGNFQVTIRKKARSVDESKCTGCGVCMAKCPQKKIPNSFDKNLGMRPAIYVPFPQAVPNTPVIDRENCTYFKSGKCGVCAKVCGPRAVDYEQQDQLIVEPAGAIVVATGFSLYDIGPKPAGSPIEGYGEFGYGTIPDVIDGLTFERLASASGPTGGKIVRPSDGKEPKQVVFVQCVGSRAREKGISYCSKICCMYTAKHTMLYKHKVHDGQAYVFFMDARTPGKNYDEFWRRAIEEEEAVYIRGMVSRLYQKGDKVVVMGSDVHVGVQVEIEADLVVLATAVQAREGADSLAQKLGISYDNYNFYSEAHAKLKPVECATAGVYLAGACQGPKDIPDTVSQASAAAAKVMTLFARDELEREPIVAKVDERRCVACLYCKKICPYGAVEEKEIRDRQGNLIRVVAYVNPGVCGGCGTCQATCPSKSVELDGYTDEQIMAMIEVL